MRILFKKRGSGLYATLIRWWTGSPYTHCELLLAGGTLISAVEPIGVRIAYILDGEIDHDVWEAVDFPVGGAQEAKIYTWAAGELGSGYDWRGIFLTQFLKFGIHSRTKWFCSEFCTAAIQQLGYVSRVKPHTIHVGKFYKIIQDLKNGS